MNTKPARIVSPDEALSRLQNLCSTQEKCSGEIKEKLRRWNISQNDGIKILRFAGFFVRDKQKINKWGKEKIRFALRSKGLSQELINEALSSLPPENFEDALRELLSKKSKELGKYDAYEKKNRLIRFAIQRGFEYDLIFKVVEDFLKE